MKKAILISILAVVMQLADTVIAEAQQSKVYRLGFLVGPGKPEESIHTKGLRHGLREAGYVEGKNLQLNIPTVRTYDELRPIAKDYVEKKVDVIVTTSATATFIARDATIDIPIIFVSGVGDPIASGLVRSLARPGGNITGLTSEAGDQMYPRRLELFKEAVTGLRRVAILYNGRGENPGHSIRAALLRETAPKLGLMINEKPVKSVKDIDDALRSVSKRNSDGLFIICSGLFAERVKEIYETAILKKLPTYECHPEGPSTRALLSYEPDRYSIGYRAASYVDRVLKGVTPNDLPVEQPTKFEFVINLKTAKQIGLTIPPNVLARADRVIK